jgi:hypothetical protein
MAKDQFTWYLRRVRFLSFTLLRYIYFCFGEKGRERFWLMVLTTMEQGQSVSKLDPVIYSWSRPLRSSWQLKDVHGEIWVSGLKVPPTRLTSGISPYSFPFSPFPRPPFTLSHRPFLPLVSIPIPYNHETNNKTDAKKLCDIHCNFDESIFYELARKISGDKKFEYRDLDYTLNMKVAAGELEWVIFWRDREKGKGRTEVKYEGMGGV